MKWIVLVCFILMEVATFYNYRDTAILKGYHRTDEDWEKDAFQDSTDYCMYYYDEKYDVKFEQDERYSEVTDETLKELEGYIEDFTMWYTEVHQDRKYTFDESIFSQGDFMYLKTGNEERDDFDDPKTVFDIACRKYSNYTIYLYDKESHTLHYMHNNI